MEQLPGIPAEGPSGDNKSTQEASSRKGLRKIIPEGFMAELYRLFVLAGPMFLYQLLIFMIFVVSTIFCGHLGKLELAAVTLGVAFVNICGVSVGYGMASACDTLMSQILTSCVSLGKSLNPIFLSFIPLGFGNAACVRVGNALGAGDIQAAKKTTVTSVLATCGIFFVIGSLLTIFKDMLGRIFTNDEEVNALVTWVMPVYIAFNLFESLCCVCGAVLRGTGKVVFGAAVNAVSYYAIGLPIGAVLVFVAKIGVRGLWLGMLVCAIMATITFIVYTARINWNLASEEAQKRAGLHQESESTSPSPGLEKVAISSVATGSNPGITLMRYSKTESHTDLLPPLEAASTLSGPRNVLSLKQLVVRRGLSLLLTVTVLILGVMVRIMIPLH
ncbi:multidrug and toxin extrusion protein 2-like [Gracilinanus agilis]|uniref:multidrug and toxin extrusion protein 2-like n=1 Tax=Gracilinanus agilis TaxID=191870 RepID=UPI001CFDD60A|nr:multidrug and toxin extrusion protein 2-like [Gracilinanus agilis]